MKDHTKLTLGQLLTDLDPTVRRNAMSILKQLQRLESIASGERIMRAINKT